MRARVLAAAGALAVGSGLVGCSSGGGTSSGSGPIAVTATDTACTVSAGSLPAGKHTFEVTNKGSKVTEFYVYAKGDRAVGEVENIAPALSRRLVVELAEGTYEATCKPGMTGTGIRSTLTVSGTAPSASQDSSLTAAVATYEQYVKAQAEPLVTQTRAFTDAIRAGDVAKAKALYPMARTYYERIEPIAESFGDLDPRIDARENDVDPGTEWTGFHRLEKDLWSGADLAKDAAVANQLDADVAKLQQLIGTLALTPLQLANGAKELLDEVASSKVTGEEDRYSHTDLYDFQANVEGSKAAVAALRPALDARDASLGTELDTRFAAVQAELDRYRTGSGFVAYTQLDQAQVKALADVVNGVAEPVSRVPGAVA